jgi:hypothetical protein
MMTTETNMLPIQAIPSMNIENGCIAHIYNVCKYLLSILLLVVGSPSSIHILNLWS